MYTSNSTRDEEREQQIKKHQLDSSVHSTDYLLNTYTKTVKDFVVKNNTK